MKLKILSLDWPLIHKSIEHGSFFTEQSLDEYDVLLINPVWIENLRHLHPFTKIDADTYSFGGTYIQAREIKNQIDRKKKEIQNLIEKSNGVVVIKTLPSYPKIHLKCGSGEIHYYHRYDFLPYFKLQEEPRVNFPQCITFEIKNGNEIIPNEKSKAIGFFRAFKGKMKYETVLDMDENFIEKCDILAKNRVGQIVSIAIPIASGNLIFLPQLKDPDPEKEAGVILNLIGELYEGPIREEPPKWVKNYELIGEKGFDKQISGIEEEINNKQLELQELTGQREEITNYKRLLWATGKRVLEPVVRRSFRLIGFNVPEPEEYPGEDYDVILYSPEGNALGEVEGSINMVDKAKYRQLLDYTDNEAMKENEFKGLLIGNGKRKIPVEERGEQFTKDAIIGCNRQKFCMLPTSELFKIVQKVLENPENEKFKKDIRKKILSHVGDFKFES